MGVAPKEKKSKPVHCTAPGCTRYARDGKRLCIRHNGGRRCERPLCTKAAQGKTSLCISHGGGRRCTTPGCPKGAQRRGKCTRCGGGERCSWPNCTTAAQERMVINEAAGTRSPRCAKHGGARKCAFPDCMKTADSYSPPPFFCSGHGGRPRCRQCAVGPAVRGFDRCGPCGGGRLCDFANCRQLVEAKKNLLCRRHTKRVEASSLAVTTPSNQQETSFMVFSDDSSPSSSSSF